MGRSGGWGKAPGTLPLYTEKGLPYSGSPFCKCPGKVPDNCMDTRIWYCGKICPGSVTVHSLSPRGVFTLFLRDKPEIDMREIAVLRFLCIGCCERSEQ